MYATENFGEHIMIDGYGGDKTLLDDRDVVLNCLKDLPKMLSMRALSEPKVYEAPDNGLKDPGGWSGFVVIAESHISIHTFPKRRFISADVYSCRNGLDQAQIIDFFKDKFSLEDIETHFVKRGTRYPSHNFS